MIGVLVYKWRVLNQTVLNGPGVNDTQLFKTFTVMSHIIYVAEFECQKLLHIRELQRQC